MGLPRGRSLKRSHRPLDGPADRLYIPGSSTKLFSVSATLDELGFGHRFETPVYAQGNVNNGTLRGNLVLVASGDLTMGGRTAPNGTVSYTHIDHTYANSVPGATLTPENPLGGLNEIARQVRKSGVKRVEGDVVIDDRLFELAPKGEASHAWASCALSGQRAQVMSKDALVSSGTRMVVMRALRFHPEDGMAPGKRLP